MERKLTLESLRGPGTLAWPDFLMVNRVGTTNNEQEHCKGRSLLKGQNGA